MDECDVCRQTDQCEFCNYNPIIDFSNECDVCRQLDCCYACKYSIKKQDAGEENA